MDVLSEQCIPFSTVTAWCCNSFSTCSGVHKLNKKTFSFIDVCCDMNNNNNE